MTASNQAPLGDRVAIAVQFALGLALLGYSAGRITGTIAYSPPAGVFLLIGIGFVITGLWEYRNA